MCSDGMELQCFQMLQSWQSWYLSYPEVLPPHTRKKVNKDNECGSKKKKGKCNDGDDKNKGTTFSLDGRLSERLPD